ncbi:MAG: TonB-dependent receptor [Cellvibrio sp.]|uniref:TonB-dependent receptor n=1 Tax=Cellvibrio sp. TaxID=1965322 RepID=UPI0031B493DB
MKQLTMKRTLLCTSIATIMGTLSSGMVFAQDDGSVEEVVITGIRGSLVQSMDVKRDSTGVVDAISAEDIGKMPDTNLAESLQRITGVSIDRNNGEGSRVTVRGFGPDYNVITLNGRQMPAANLAATSASNSRSYDFANLAAESVAGVEVYKTGQAKLSTGGIGSLINIKTARPLEMPGITASLGVKGASDTSNRTGSDITPEVSGIYSQTFADDTIGVALVGSYQERDGGYNTAETSSGWITNKGSVAVSNNTAGIENLPQENDVYAVAQNLMYSINDIQRKRTNAQLTMQWAPSDTLTGTVDYTYSEMDVEQHRQELSVWFWPFMTGGSFTKGTNSKGSVVAPVIYKDDSTADIGMGVGDWGTINEGNSVGLNLNWKATDNLTLAFDYHNSDAEAGSKDDRGSNNIVTAVQYNRASTTVDYSKDFPVMDITYADGKGLEPAKFQSSGTSFRNSYMKSEIEQAQLNGKYEFNDSLVKSIDFGLSLTDNTGRSAFSNAQRDTWGGYGGAEYFDDSLFTRRNLGSEFDSISGSSNPNLEPHYYDVDFKGFTKAIADASIKYNDKSAQLYFCGTTPRLCADPVFSDDRTVEEEQTAAYVQGNMSWEWGTMPTNLAVGMRYEETDLTASAVIPNYTALTWVSSNEFSATREGEITAQATNKYDNFLPNVDFDISVTDDVVLRSSYSVTIARPSYLDLQAGKSIGLPVRRLESPGSAGNPELEPFESTNLDFSSEWYYAEGSYVSLGYYKKDVENFIGYTSFKDTTYNLYHPGLGQRYNEANAATGNTNNPEIIRNYILSQNGGAPIVGNSTDPLAEFSLVTPVNSREASIDGWEFAIQHLFGESGFGGIINYTTVNGDINYDNYNTNRGEGVDNQFALFGLSDSANFVVFYDKNGLQARVAYNWRDDFLTAAFDGNGQRNPIYTEAYGQVDVNVSYDINEQISVFVEGINITDETQRMHGRHKNMVISAVQSGPRYNIGARYKF